MPDAAPAARGVYKPRRPQASPLFRLVSDHLQRLQTVYDERFALAGFQAVAGQSFMLTAVPQPQTLALWLAGLLGLAGCTRRGRRAS